MVSVAAAACGISVRRDLSAIPAGQIGFDDVCGLQDYFDGIAIRGAPPPALVSASGLEGSSGGKPIRGGRDRYAFRGDFQLRHLRRVLGENWQGLPPELARADKVELEVRWSEKAGVRRVVTDQDATLAIGARTFALPYQVCLSELVYGEPLYRQRRALWGAPRAPGDTGFGDAGTPPPPPPDGGTPPDRLIDAPPAL
jgi:hypothetical protein